MREKEPLSSYMNKEKEEYSMKASDRLQRRLFERATERGMEILIRVAGENKMRKKEVVDCQPRAATSSEWTYVEIQETKIKAYERGHDKKSVHNTRKWFVFFSCSQRRRSPPSGRTWAPTRRGEGHSADPSLKPPTLQPCPAAPHFRPRPSGSHMPLCRALSSSTCPQKRPPTSRGRSKPKTLAAVSRTAGFVWTSGRVRKSRRAIRRLVVDKVTFREGSVSSEPSEPYL
jgi:hypothetical protein